MAGGKYLKIILELTFEKPAVFLKSQISFWMVAYSAFVRSAGIIMLCPITFKYFCSAVIHSYRHGNLRNVIGSF